MAGSLRVILRRRRGVWHDELDRDMYVSCFGFWVLNLTPSAIEVR